MSIPEVSKIWNDLGEEDKNKYKQQAALERAAS
jgi:hypothetical protein